MQRLSSLRNGTMQADAGFPVGAYAYGLNVALEATSGQIVVNSKRMDRDFRLTSVNSANLAVTTNWSIGLGTEEFDWFGDFVRAECILGDAVLPHFLPSAGMVISKGDSIVCRVRNDEAVAKRIALLFQGEHI